MLLSDPAVAEVPAEDCGEALVGLRRIPELLVDTRRQDSVGAWARLRAGVLTRLLQAQRALPSGVRLLVTEGHRPAALQQYYFNGHRADLADAHPDWSARRLDAEASKHVSPPSVAPHPCGAAVDLTLVHDGQELDLGTPVNVTPEGSANACFTAAENIPDTTRPGTERAGSHSASHGGVSADREGGHSSHGGRRRGEAATGGRQ